MDKIMSAFQNIAKDRGYTEKVSDDVYKTEVTCCGRSGGVSSYYIRLLSVESNKMVIFDSKIGREEIREIPKDL